jgi:DNA-binding PucR family transcriptional regulator
MLGERESFIAALFEVTRDEVRALDHDTRMRTLLEASITENIVSAVNFLDNGTALEDLEAPTAALTYARTLAQRDVPLSALIRAYRIGHSRFLDAVLEIINTAPAEDQMDVVLHFVRRSADYIDKVCEQVGRSYEAERDRWVSSRSGLRQQSVNEILQGTSTDIVQAEETLLYSFDRTHVAVEAWPDADVSGFDVVKLFDDVGKVVGNVLKAIGPPLLVPNDEREVRMWFSVREGTRPDAAQLTAALKSAGLAVQVAVGDPQRGVEGFRLSLRQAERVKGIKLAAGGAEPSVVTFAQVAPVALMAGDLPELKRFVMSRLGSLAVDDERSLVLRETLRVFLDRNRSYAGAAQIMMMHRNSIQYRVQQAMEVCGQDLDEPGVAFELQAALVAARWLGASVLNRA